MDIPEAEDLAARTLAAINDPPEWWDLRVHDDHRERVASDLAGLRQCAKTRFVARFILEPHAARYADGLRRTAALYGVTDGQ